MCVCACVHTDVCALACRLSVGWAEALMLCVCVHVCVQVFSYAASVQLPPTPFSISDCDVVTRGM